MYLRRIERLRYEPIAELPGFTCGLDFAAGRPPDGGVWPSSCSRRRESKPRTPSQSP